MAQKRVLLLLLLISTPVFPRRSGGSGGFSGSRGSSGARGGVASGGSGGGFASGPSSGGGFRPQTNTAGGFNSANSGGFRQNQPQPGWNGGHNSGFGNQGGGFRPNTFGGSQGNFRPSGVGSKASSGTWKTALAAGALGAVGGIVAWEAGKAIIHSASTPFSQGGRNYYWDDHYQNKNGMTQCRVPLSDLQTNTATTTTTTTTTASSVAAVDGASTTTTAATPSAENIFNHVEFKDGSRPKFVTWGCQSATEECCGTECCPRVQRSSGSNGMGQGGGSTGSSVGTIVLLAFSCLVVNIF